MAMLLLLSLSLLMVISCKDYEDVPGPSDPRLARKYCNDPEAVNYNREFPGTEDNSVCVYPADAFKGQYAFVDSIYDGTNKLIAQQSLLLDISADNRNDLMMRGFCPGNSPISLTANRQLRAVVDTLVLEGQLLCRIKDTLSGYVSQSQTDSIRMKFYFTVVSDTGVNFHEGTAYRQ